VGGKIYRRGRKKGRNVQKNQELRVRIKEKGS
jgi:hypothetical protein